MAILVAVKFAPETVTASTACNVKLPSILIVLLLSINVVADLASKLVLRLPPNETKPANKIPVVFAGEFGKPGKSLDVVSVSALAATLLTATMRALLSTVMALAALMLTFSPSDNQDDKVTSFKLPKLLALWLTTTLSALITRLPALDKVTLST